MEKKEKEMLISLSDLCGYILDILHPIALFGCNINHLSHFVGTN